MSRLFNTDSCQAPVAISSAEQSAMAAMEGGLQSQPRLGPGDAGWTRSYKGKSARIYTYENLPALCARVAGSGKSFPADEFNGHCSTARAIELARSGAGEKIMAEVRRIVDQIDTAFRERPLAQWVETPAGAFPVVPEFLQGRPECMRIMQSEQHDRAPLRIVIECSISVGVSNTGLIRRGAALTALIMRLVEERPVNVEICWPMQTEKGAIVGLLRINAAPVNPSETAYLLAEPGFNRNLAHLASFLDAGADPASDLWFIWKMDPDHPDRIDLLRGLLGLSPTDIFIPGAKLEKNGKIYLDPVGWVEERIREQRARGVDV